MQASLHTLAVIEASSDVEVLHALCASVPTAKWAALLLESGGLRGLVLRDDMALNAALPRRAVEALRAAFELTRRHHLAEDHRPRLTSPESIFNYLRPQLGHLPHERFVVLSLNARNALLGCDVVAEGSVDQCHVDPRAVFSAALSRGATRLVMAHNHPSGESEPSVPDITLTRQLKAAAETLCIRLVDHLIITNTGFVSMMGRGLLLR